VQQWRLRRVRVEVRVRVRVRVTVSVSISLNKYNSGADELTDKYVTFANIVWVGYFTVTCKMFNTGY